MRGATGARLALLAALVAGCQPTVVGRVPLNDLHEVHGYWLQVERPCEGERLVDCRTAIAIVEAEGDVVVRASDGGIPAYRRTASGDVEPTGILGGLALPSFIVLDLADGARRVVTLQCGPQPVAGASLMERTCHAFDYSAFRIGPLPSAGG